MSSIAAVLMYQTPELVADIRQQLGNNWVLIDNGSTPPIPRGHTRMSIRIRENAYFSGGWNRAMELLFYDWVWMLNSDLQGITPNLLSRLVEQAESLNAAVLSPTVNSPHAQMTRSGTNKVPWIDWICPLVSRKWWDEVGPFDTNFKGYGADLDWCKRASDKGASFYVTSQVHIQHKGSYTAFKTTMVQNDTGKMEQLIRKKWGKSWTNLFS